MKIIQDDKRFSISGIEKREVKNLKKSALVELFAEVTVDKYYIEQFRYFDGIQPPIIIDEEDYVHSGYDVVRHLMAAKVKTVSVLVVKGIENEVDGVRLTNFASFFQNCSYKDMAKAYEYLNGLLTADKYGKEWAKIIPGKYTRDKICTITKTSTGQLAKLKIINDNCPEELDQVDANKRTLEEVHEEAKEINPNKRKPKEKKVVSPSTDKVRELIGLTLVFSDAEYQVEIEGQDVKIRNPDNHTTTAIIEPYTKRQQGGDLAHIYGFHLNPEQYLSIKFMEKNIAA